MQTGVIIDSGLIDWQIIQQENGYGKICLKGHYLTSQDKFNVHVWVRVLREDNSEPLVFWKCAENDGDNSWGIVIPSIPVGGLYRVETCLKEDECIYFADALRGDMIHHIGVGDVYVIAGQSNSSGFGKDSVMDEPILGVHLLKNSNRWDLATHPMNDSTNTKHSVNQETINSGHSPYLSFAKYLKKELGYPIGLIQTALGGSPLSKWNPKEDGALYQNMIEIIEEQNGVITGVLWYQGCTEACEELHENYYERFREFTNELRTHLKASVPIFTVQLNRLTECSSDIKNTAWSSIREDQRRASKEIENVFMVPAIDGTMSDLIHNSAAFNIVLGERIAKKALSKIYNKSYMADAPDLKLAILHKNELTLEFENVYDILDTFNAEASDLLFRVVDDQGVIQIKSYKLWKKCIILELAREVKGKCKVSNAYGQNPQGIHTIDLGTHYPIVAFWNEKVVQEETF